MYTSSLVTTKEALYIAAQPQTLFFFLSKSRKRNWFPFSPLQQCSLQRVCGGAGAACQWPLCDCEACSP
jgi:hypothetical protein